MSKIVDVLIGKRELHPPQIPIGTEPLSEWDGALWTAVLQRSVSNTGVVDYEVLRIDTDFLRLVDIVSKQSPISHPERFPTSESKLSFWINVYNLMTIWAVLSDNISTSVQDSQVSSWLRINAGQDFFVANRVLIGGEWMNLYDLEHKIIRTFGDGRIHAAINCASNSCPVLENQAFNANELDTRLGVSMRRMVNSTTHLTVDTETQIVWASQIFKWYLSDFDARSKKDLFEYWLQFAAEPLLSLLNEAASKRYSIKWKTYDWGLNGVIQASK